MVFADGRLFCVEQFAIGNLPHGQIALKPRRLADAYQMRAGRGKTQTINPTRMGMGRIESRRGTFGRLEIRINELTHDLASCDRPDPNSAIAASRGDELAVRTERHAVHGFAVSFLKFLLLVSLEFADQAAAGGIP